MHPVCTEELQTILMTAVSLSFGKACKLTRGGPCSRLAVATDCQSSQAGKSREKQRTTAKSASEKHLQQGTEKKKHMICKWSSICSSIGSVEMYMSKLQLQLVYSVFEAVPLAAQDLNHGVPFFLTTPLPSVPCHHMSLFTQGRKCISQFDNSYGCCR